MNIIVEVILIILSTLSFFSAVFFFIMSIWTDREIYFKLLMTSGVIWVLTMIAYDILKELK